MITKDQQESILKSLIVDERLSAPLYVQVREGLDRLIEDHFQDGDLFYSESDLVRRLGISRFTVRQAFDELSRAGAIHRRRGQGSFVRKRSATHRLLQHVGAFIGTYDSEYATTMLELLSEICSRQGLQLHIYHTERDERISEAYERVVRPPDSEGILLLQCSLPLYKPLAQRSYRAVALEPQVLDYSGPSVETDSKAAVEIGVEHLLSLGHRRIALLVTEYANNLSVLEKIDTFERLCAENPQLQGQVIDCGVVKHGSPCESAYACMRDVWFCDQRPTAVLTVSDFGAFGVLNWCADNGVKVPEDLSVLGYEGIRSGAAVRPALSSVAHPMRSLAERLIEMLLTNAKGHDRLSPSLILRASTAPPR